MSQLALDGRDSRIKTYRNSSCLCDRGAGDACWAARCLACGEPLTKHAFTEQNAHDEAVHALDEVDRRVAEHLAAVPPCSPLVRAAIIAGSTVTLARTIPGGTRTLERRMKRSGGLSRHCPVCRAAGAYHR